MKISTSTDHREALTTWEFDAGGLAAIIVGNYLNRYGFRGPLVVVLAGAAISCGCQLLTVFEMPAWLGYNALADLPGSIGGSFLITF